MTLLWTTGRDEDGNVVLSLTPVDGAGAEIAMTAEDARSIGAALTASADKAEAEARR